MKVRRGFLLVEVIVSIVVLSLVIIQVSKLIVTTKTYVHRRMMQDRLQLLAEDLEETISIEFQYAKTLVEVVTTEGQKCSLIGQEEIEIKRIVLMQYRKFGSINTKEVKKMITIDPESERKSLWFAYKESDTVSVKQKFEAGTGVEKMSISKHGDGIYRIGIRVSLEGDDKQHFFLVKIGKK